MIPVTGWVSDVGDLPLAIWGVSGAQVTSPAGLVATVGDDSVIVSLSGSSVSVPIKAWSQVRAGELVGTLALEFDSGESVIVGDGALFVDIPDPPTTYKYGFTGAPGWPHARLCVGPFQ